MKIAHFLVLLLVLGLLAGCANPGQTSAESPTLPLAVTPLAASPTVQPSPTRVFSPTAIATQQPQLTIIQPTSAVAASPTAAATWPVPTAEPPLPTALPGPTLAPDAWMSLPIIPTVSNTTRAIYERGQKAGNNPNAFSKVGDCESRTQWFLADFDSKQPVYTLGSYSNLQAVIDHFQGSFGRLSVASLPGFTSASVLTPLWADPKLCSTNETPLSCEYRIHRPSFALIMLGTNDAPHLDKFEANMRTIIQFTIDQGIVPILSTKADDLEGNNQINATIAQLANEYDIPLWNFWRSVQSLPNGGLQADKSHLTFGTNHFDNASSMQSAWPVRNLTALQALDAVWRGVTETTQP